MALSEAYHHTTSKPALLKKVVGGRKEHSPMGPKTERAASDEKVAETTAKSPLRNRWRSSKMVDFVDVPMPQVVEEAVEVVQISPERASKRHRTAIKNESLRRV